MDERKVVQVREVDSDKVVLETGPMPKRKAERVELGIAINMDHDRYYTEVVDAK